MPTLCCQGAGTWVRRSTRVRSTGLGRRLLKNISAVHGKPMPASARCNPSAMPSTCMPTRVPNELSVCTGLPVTLMRWSAIERPVNVGPATCHNWRRSGGDETVVSPRVAARTQPKRQGKVCCAANQQAERLKREQERAQYLPGTCTHGCLARASIEAPVRPGNRHDYRPRSHWQ